MFFRKQPKDIDTIVERLASMGIEKNGKSLFLDSEDISSDLVLDFVKKCGLTEYAFRLAEDVLRFSNVYNTLTVLLQLKDKTLEKQILAKLREPSLFLARYEPKPNFSREETLNHVAKGFGFFMDHLEFSERFLVIGANEILA